MGYPEVSDGSEPIILSYSHADHNLFSLALLCCADDGLD